MVKANIGHSTTILPSLPESSQSSESARILAQYLTGEPLRACHIQFDSGASRKEDVAIPDVAVRLLAKILEELAKRNAMTASSASMGADDSASSRLVERFTAFFGPATRQRVRSSALDLDRKDFVKFDQRFTRPAEVDILLGDGSKDRDELGWMPEVDFKGLVKMMVEHDFDLAYREKRALES